MNNDSAKKLLEKLGDEKKVANLIDSLEFAVKDSPETPAEGIVKEVFELTSDDLKGLKKNDLDSIEAILLGQIKAMKESEKSKPPVKEKNKKKPETITVYLSPNIALYGGRFYDSSVKTWIKGTKSKPQKVKFTLFVEQKLATKELIEVR